jgi:hypothetical protein
MSNTQEKWFVKYWRPAAAWIYLAICVFDFVIMPVYVAKTNLKLEDVVKVASTFEGSEKLGALTLLMKKNTWEPLTVMESGMFHLSFGAILGVAAYTRGRVQEAQVNQQSARQSVDNPNYSPS